MKISFFRIYFGIVLILLGLGFIADVHYGIDLTEYIIPGFLIILGVEVIIVSIFKRKDSPGKAEVEIIPVLKMVCRSCKKDISIEYYKAVPGRIIECENCKKNFKIKSNVEEKIYKVKNELTEILDDAD